MAGSPGNRPQLALVIALHVLGVYTCKAALSYCEDYGDANRFLPDDCESWTERFPLCRALWHGSLTFLVRQASYTWR